MQEYAYLWRKYAILCRSVTFCGERLQKYAGVCIRSSKHLTQLQVDKGVHRVVHHPANLWGLEKGRVGLSLLPTIVLKGAFLTGSVPKWKANFLFGTENGVKTPWARILKEGQGFECYLIPIKGHVVLMDDALQCLWQHFLHSPLQINPERMEYISFTSYSKICAMSGWQNLAAKINSVKYAIYTM